MFEKFTAFISYRFIKFCTVGASGVVVNLAILAGLADGLGIHVNLASALAIEASIISNFVINELWTFRDRHQTSDGAARRLGKFHLVSIVGAIIQWLAFIFINSVWVILVGNGSAFGDDTGSGMLTRYIIAPVTHPPDVGHLKYISQLIGIGMATCWNYVANFHWTWALPENGSKQ